MEGPALPTQHRYHRGNYFKYLTLTKKMSQIFLVASIVSYGEKTFFTAYPSLMFFFTNNEGCEDAVCSLLVKHDESIYKKNFQV